MSLQRRGRDKSENVINNARDLLAKARERPVRKANDSSSFEMDGDPNSDDIDISISDDDGGRNERASTAVTRGRAAPAGARGRVSTANSRRAPAEAEDSDPSLESWERSMEAAVGSVEMPAKSRRGGTNSRNNRGRGAAPVSDDDSIDISISDDDAPATRGGNNKPLPPARKSTSSSSNYSRRYKDSSEIDIEISDEDDRRPVRKTSNIPKRKSSPVYSDDSDSVEIEISDEDDRRASAQRRNNARNEPERQRRPNPPAKENVMNESLEEEIEESIPEDSMIRGSNLNNSYSEDFDDNVPPLRNTAPSSGTAKAPVVPALNAQALSKATAAASRGTAKAPSRQPSRASIIASLSYAEDDFEAFSESDSKTPRQQKAPAPAVNVAQVPVMHRPPLQHGFRSPTGSARGSIVSPRAQRVLVLREVECQTDPIPALEPLSVGFQQQYTEPFYPYQQYQQQQQQFPHSFYPSPHYPQAGFPPPSSYGGMPQQNYHSLGYPPAPMHNNYFDQWNQVLSQHGASAPPSHQPSSSSSRAYESQLQNIMSSLQACRELINRDTQQLSDTFKFRTLADTQRLIASQRQAMGVAQ